jgi:hypothetical protein
MEHKYRYLISLDLCIEDKDKYILFPANKQEALTMVSLRAGNISPIFCSTVLGC